MSVVSQDERATIDLNQESSGPENVSEGPLRSDREPRELADELVYGQHIGTFAVVSVRVTAC